MGSIFNPSGGGVEIANAEVFNAIAPTSWTDLDLSSIVGAKPTLVILSVKLSSGSYIVAFRKNGDAVEYNDGAATLAGGCVQAMASGSWARVITLMTDANGVIEWIESGGQTTIIKVLGWAA